MKKKLVFAAVAAILVIGIVFGIVACNKNNGSATDSLENPFVENYVEMVQNTKIDIIVKPMADNSYRFEAWRRTEKYEGDRKVLFTVTAKCQQTTLTVFDYEEADYTITDADKLNLA